MSYKLSTRPSFSLLITVPQHHAYIQVYDTHGGLSHRKKFVNKRILVYLPELQS